MTCRVAQRSPENGITDINYAINRGKIAESGGKISLHYGHGQRLASLRQTIAGLCQT